MVKFNTLVKIHSHKNELECVTKNVTALGGRIAMENIFKAGTAFQENIRQSLNKTLEIAKGSSENYENPSEGLLDDTTSVEDYFNRKVQYFCIGTGGVNNGTPLEMAKPRNHESRLYNMVPFRCVPIEYDLSESQRSNYRLRRRERIKDRWYFTYYLKKFEIGDIRVEKADGTPYIIHDDHSSPIVSGDTSHPLLNTSVHVFYEFFMYIDPEDFKEYYKALNNDLEGAKLTEFGLVLANEGEYTVNSISYDEIYNAELFSKVVHSPSYMDQEENAKRITYNIFS